VEVLNIIDAPMKYPNGSKVEVGNAIWWDGGTQVAYVRAIFETVESFQAIGLSEPSIGLSFYSGDSEFEVTVPERAFVPEGVEQLTDHEYKILKMKLAQALDCVYGDHHPVVSSSYAASLIVANSQVIAWQIAFKKNKKLQLIVRIDT
jgi:hypothetical protein